MPIAIYPGSFDPITMGHIDILTRASRLFDQVILAVVTNPGKTSFLSPDERVRLAETSTQQLSNVRVVTFDGLTVDVAKQQNATVIIRGLRALSDFETEFKMAQMNKRLAPELETLFMMAGLEHQFLSSSLVKEVSAYGADIKGLVPEPVMSVLKKHKR